MSFLLILTGFVLTEFIIGANNLQDKNVMSEEIFGKMSWSVAETTPEQLKRRITKKKIETFNYHRVGSDPEDPDYKIGIGDYDFIDLNNDGSYELVFTDDMSGRGFYAIKVVQRIEQGYKIHYGIGGFNEAEISDIVVDLNKDGIKEILVLEPIEEEVRGFGNITFWTAIYNWDGEKLIRVDEKFPEYYQNILIEAAENIKELNDELREHKDLLLPKEKEDIKRRLAGLRLLFEKAQKIVEKK